MFVALATFLAPELDVLGPLDETGALARSANSGLVDSTTRDGRQAGGGERGIVGNGT